MGAAQMWYVLAMQQTDMGSRVTLYSMWDNLNEALAEANTLNHNSEYNWRYFVEHVSNLPLYQ